jgi:hypothetical protein
MASAKNLELIFTPGQFFDELTTLKLGNGSAPSTDEALILKAWKNGQPQTDFISETFLNELDTIYNQFFSETMPLTNNTQELENYSKAVTDYLTGLQNDTSFNDISKTWVQKARYLLSETSNEIRYPLLTKSYVGDLAKRFAKVPNAMKEVSDYLLI